MADLKITEVQTFLTQPHTQRLIVVKVLTNEPGLYGLGCATYTQRHRAVEAALKHHIGPFVIGKDPRNSEDIWQSAMVNGYWRNGPVINNAVSGIDMALWDIKGKLAGLPCYQLFGGKSRAGAAVYTHTGGRELAEIADNARAKMEQGYRYIRCQIGGYVGQGAGPGPKGAAPGVYFDPKEKLYQTPALFEYLRDELGDGVEFVHDVHERLAPVDAVWLAKALEPYRLFFLEDLLAPEDIEWFAHIRSVCATPLAMGELFNHPREWTPLIANRQIDFIRCHVSQLGGVTPAMKLAHLADAFGVRTAWHGPLDTSPIGMMACVHMDVALRNFGIQEWANRNEAEHEIFPGLAQVENGYVYPNEQPGWGIDFNADAAAKFPCDDDNPEWTVSRLPDGSMWRP